MKVTFQKGIGGLPHQYSRAIAIKATGSDTVTDLQAAIFASLAQPSYHSSAFATDLLLVESPQGDEDVAEVEAYRTHLHPDLIWT
jgi:hypothetical protein